MPILRPSLYYPRAFWLLLVGFFINRASAALIWPFLTLVIRERLAVPLTTVTLLISVQAVAGLLSTSVVGVVMDRFGRKRAMMAGLLGGSAVLVAMAGANALWQWGVLIALYGALVPVFLVGANAMVADLVEPEKRVNAYALMRMIANVGIAIGPVVGGFLITQSTALTYHVTAIINILVAVLVALFLRETLSRQQAVSADKPRGGYGAMLRDRAFMSFCGVFTLLELAIATVFVLLPVYTKENFGIQEYQYGWLLTINAGMVVLLQFGVTRLSARFAPLPVLAVGALFYVAGLSILGMSTALAGFALGIAVFTIGELLAAPTSTAMVANLAPPHMRARYMGVYSLTYTVGSGIGPVIGGFLSDQFAPAAIWYGGALFALASAVGFLLMARAVMVRSTPEPEPLVVRVET